MRVGLFSLVVLFLAGCSGATQWRLLHEELGRTIADVTLVAGMPHKVGDLPDGTRVYQWRRARLVPRGGGPCTYSLTAVREGRPASLASWRVVGIEVPGPGCEPLVGGYRSPV